MTPDDIMDPEESEAYEDESDLVVMTDEDGVDTVFEFLDIVECDGKSYVVLLPVENAENGEVVIFRIEGEGDDETYVGVETAEEAARVFEVFRKQAGDRFNFIDEA